MRKIKKVPLFVDIEFNDSIPQEKIREVVQKVADALNNAIDSENGLSPTDDNGLNMTSVNKVRIMCKGVVLLTEDHTQMTTDGGRVIDIQNIEGVVVESQAEKQLDNAISILQAILKENNELPENYKPYWEEDEDEE